MATGATGHRGEDKGDRGHHDAPLAQTSCAAGVRPAGLIHHTGLITPRGLRKVQNLAPGDHLVTHDGCVTALQRIERQSVVARAIYVIGGSIGHVRPDRDTMLAAGQYVLVRDWRAWAFGAGREALVRADRLVDGEYVRDIGLQAMTIYRLYCAGPQVFYADGMELASADSIPGTRRRG